MPGGRQSTSGQGLVRVRGRDDGTCCSIVFLQYCLYVFDFFFWVGHYLFSLLTVVTMSFVLSWLGFTCMYYVLLACIMFCAVVRRCTARPGCVDVVGQAQLRQPAAQPDVYYHHLPTHRYRCTHHSRWLYRLLRRLLREAWLPHGGMCRDLTG